MRTSTKQRFEVLGRLRDVGLDYDTANQLRRISLILNRWFEYECGTENAFGMSFCIERDEQTKKPFMRVQYNSGNQYIDRRHPVADREAVARRRLAKIMAAHPGLVAYVQTDCRSCALYILRQGQDIKLGENIEQIYNRGIAVY